MPRQPNRAELRLRSQVAFYMGEGSLKLSDPSFRWLAKDDRVKLCVLTLAEKAPARMQPIFEEAALVAASARERNREEAASKERNRKEAASKDTAPDPDSAHGSKRMNEDVGSPFAEEAANRDCVKKARMNGPDTGNVTENKSSDEDRGVREMQTDAVPNLAGQSNSANDVEDDSSEEGTHEMRVDENPQPAEEIGNPPAERASENVDNEITEEMETSGHYRPTESLMNAHDVGEVIKKEKIDDDEREDGDRYEEHPHDIEIDAELGLSREDPEVLAFLTEEFYAQRPHLRIRCSANLKPITEAIAQLDFYQTQAVVVDYFKECLKGSSADREAIPLTCGMSDPHQVFDTLTVIQNSTNHGKIHRACGRIDLFKSVNSKIVGTESASPSQKLEELASEKASAATKLRKEKIKQQYIDWYHMGKNWADFTKWFDGEGVVLVFIIAGIGGYALSVQWNAVQRQFFEYASQYMPKIKQLVKALGENCLTEYTKNGFLPEDRIRALEEVGDEMEDEFMDEASDE